MKISKNLKNEIDTCKKKESVSTTRIPRVKVMEESKKQHLAKKGWKVGTVSEFLDLTPEETALVEIKLAVSRYLKERRN